MPMLSNSHLGSSVTLRLEARKSFTFNVQVREPNKRKIDCTGATFRFVAQNNRYPYENFLDDNPSYQKLDEGFVTFSFQAADLDLPSGEYPYVLVMVTAEGYSLVLMKGVIELLGNPDTLSVHDSYDESPAIEGVEVTLRGKHEVQIQVGNVLPPSMNFFSDRERESLSNLIKEINKMKKQLGMK